MNTQIIMLGKWCTDHSRELFTTLLSLILLFIAPPAQAEWKVDLSRRQKNIREQELKYQRTTNAESDDKSVVDMLFENGEPTQELVILNTEKGFVPATVRVRRGGKYVIHVVNVNEKDKNVSFVLDAFSEHHATYYGKIKTIRLEPKKEGTFSFQSPETSSEGRLIVYAAPTSLRQPASEESK